jgi:hypothetical protein
MKKEINNAAKVALKVNEIFLFKEMATSLNRHSRSMFIQETHGRKGWVQFASNLTGKNETKEIADLLIICKNQRNEIKISFLQAKYHKKSTAPFLKFYGDYLQLELLQTRPFISPNNSFRFPPHILNFSSYKSLTTYGIFYLDSNNEINLLYTIATHLKQVGKRLKGSILFPGNHSCPQINCFTGTHVEICSTCEIDLYERALLSFFIGAPIIHDASILLSIRGILSRALYQNEVSDADLIKEFIDALNENSSNDREPFYDRKAIGFPNILLVNSQEEANSRSQRTDYSRR